MTLPRPATLTVLLGLAAAALLFLLVLLWLLQGYRAAVADTADLEPRYARIQGIAEAAPQLAEAQARAQQQLESVAYAAGLEDSAVGTGIQQRVRRYATQAGLEVTGSQIQPPRSREGFVEIGVQVTVQGSLGGLQAFLASVQEEPPRLQITGLTLSPQRMRRRSRTAEPEEQVVSATLQVSGFRVQP